MNRTTIAIEQIEEDNGNRHISISGRRKMDVSISQKHLI